MKFAYSWRSPCHKHTRFVLPSPSGPLSLAPPAGTGQMKVAARAGARRQPLLGDCPAPHTMGLVPAFPELLVWGLGVLSPSSRRLVPLGTPFSSKRLRVMSAFAGIHLTLILGAGCSAGTCLTYSLCFLFPPTLWWANNSQQKQLLLIEISSGIFVSVALIWMTNPQ